PASSRCGRRGRRSSWPPASPPTCRPPRRAAARGARARTPSRELYTGAGRSVPAVRSHWLRVAHAVRSTFMPAAVVGRDAELAALRDFLAGISDGTTAFLLEGDAGMGKTTLWSAGVADATERGLRVLRALPAESETGLSFAALGDLLDPVLTDVLDELVPAQRRALSRALVLDEEAGPAPE